jgi:hypothetical protein
MKRFLNNEIILLLGAGASCDAGILNSAQMINKIEEKILDRTWEKYEYLYQYIKSMHYRQNIFFGLNPKAISFNIEDLINILNIIIDIADKKIDTYIFVGNWEKDLIPFISNQQKEKLASTFKESLIKELQSRWISPDDWIKKSSYYLKLIDFKNSLGGFPLKIFSLNYDVCVEHNLRNEKVEMGFDEQDVWNFRRYDYNDPNNEIDFYLYKIHGSIDWEQIGRDKLRKKSTGVKTDDLAIIFGLSNKLQSYDPYLFYSYEFREHCLDASLLICSGYSFKDAHINDFIKFGFKNATNKKLVVNVLGSNAEEENIENDISSKLEINEDQIVVYKKNANDFFNSDLNLENFSSLFNENIGELPNEF